MVLALLSMLQMAASDKRTIAETGSLSHDRSEGSNISKVFLYFLGSYALRQTLMVLGVIIMHVLLEVPDHPTGLAGGHPSLQRTLAAEEADSGTPLEIRPMTFPMLRVPTVQLRSS